MFFIDFLMSLLRKIFGRNAKLQEDDQLVNLNQNQGQPFVPQTFQRHRRPRRSFSFPGEERVTQEGRRRRAIDIVSSPKDTIQFVRSFQKVRQNNASMTQNRQGGDSHALQPSKSTPNLYKLSSENECQIFVNDSMENYQIVNIIEQNSSQVVISALDQISKEMVVIKLLQMDQCSSDRVKRFYKEIRVLNSLARVEGVVQLLGTIDEHPHKALVLEYCRFQSLRHVIQVIKVPLIESNVALDILPEILKALMQIHSRGIIHGCIKPEHILLNDSMSIRLGGFSTAVETGSELPYYSLGHPPYTAPEVLDKPSIDQIFQTVVIQGMDESELPQYNSKADVWSIGILVVELLLGYNPFGHCQDFQSLKSSVSGFVGKEFNRGGRLEKASKDAKDFIKQCLHLEANNRQTPKQLLAHKFISQSQIRDHSKRKTLIHVVQENVTQSMNG
eukprot:TRINITY_DN6674_c0_g1_i9.p1 TRINITY_DN6674_c0_g1~~TRINITY_DN6674_c0_g1_i9.p1  ORF type:complete len:502 (-),score=22.36 TRINITY_DN6674_c0_g1_i9:350-1687(-)